MGKRRESQGRSTRDESPEEIKSPSSHKKHKKHKKKHRRHTSDAGDVTVPESTEDVGGSPKGAIKLKLKIGTETLGTKNYVTVTSEPTDDIVNVTDDVWEDEKDPTIKTKKAGDDTSDEEKEWLKALEKGELDDYGEVNRRKKDPSLMTARQRALKSGTQEQELLQLPTGYRQVELTEEQMKRREQRAHKRKQMAHEKREKDKRQTLDRLLKKQESRKGAKNRPRRSDTPKVSYLDNVAGISVSVPQGVEFPFTPHKSEHLPARPRCAVSGCKNEKKYACSKTGVALCGLQCYKSNLSKHKLSGPGLVTT